ncbi:MAG: NAD(P)/FAD-dependent oxidoreductase [Xanthomonadales bacterium]|nr:NAD(P)/FAD-dependent oxidoreductase [Xanthomonadales bacterium]
MSTGVLIIGAGPAGLAAAYELSHRGIRPRIVDQADRVASSWRSRHEQLHLNTHRRVSHQPGMKIPRKFGTFPARDDYVSYLEDYATFLGLPIEFGIRAVRIDGSGNHFWKVETDAGRITAQHVIVATGSDQVPYIPEWPGRNEFSGELIHAAQFRHAKYYVGKRVLLVGAGNSGVDIGNHLADVDIAPSWVSIRNGPNIAPQYALGLPAQLIVARLRWLPVRLQDFNIAFVSRLALGDLSRLGIPAAPKGAVTRQREDGITLSVDNGFVAALKAKRFEVVKEIDSFGKEFVHLKDGTTIKPDAVICATGYRFGLEKLVGHLGVLDKRGWPRFVAARGSPRHPGLWFLGHNSSLYGNMNIRRQEARRLAKKIAADIS